MTRAQQKPESGAPELGLREHKKLQTRDAIHVAAMRLVAAEGLTTCTVQEICAAADVSQRTFFNYFPSKVAAVLDLPGPGFSPARIDLFAAGSGTVMDDLCDLLAGAIIDRHKSRREHRALKRLMVKYPELLFSAFEQFRTVRSELVAIAARRLDEGGARSAVAILFAAFFSITHSSKTDTRDLAQALKHAISEMRDVIDAR